MPITLISDINNVDVHATDNDKKTACGIKYTTPENLMKYTAGEPLREIDEMIDAVSKITCDKCKSVISKKIIKETNKQQAREEKEMKKKGKHSKSAEPTSQSYSAPTPSPSVSNSVTNSDDYVVPKAVKQPLPDRPVQKFSPSYATTQLEAGSNSISQGYEVPKAVKQPLPDKPVQRFKPSYVGSPQIAGAQEEISDSVQSIDLNEISIVENPEAVSKPKHIDSASESFLKQLGVPSSKPVQVQSDILSDMEDISIPEVETPQKQYEPEELILADMDDEGNFSTMSNDEIESIEEVSVPPVTDDLEGDDFLKQFAVPTAPQPVQPTVQKQPSMDLEGDNFLKQFAVPTASQPVQPTVQKQPSMDLEGDDFLKQFAVPTAPQPVQPTIQKQPSMDLEGDDFLKQFAVPTKPVITETEETPKKIMSLQEILSKTSVKDNSESQDENTRKPKIVSLSELDEEDVMSIKSNANKNVKNPETKVELKEVGKIDIPSAEQMEKAEEIEVDDFQFNTVENLTYDEEIPVVEEVVEEIPVIEEIEEEIPVIEEVEEEIPVIEEVEEEIPVIEEIPVVKKAPAPKVAIPSNKAVKQNSTPRVTKIVETPVFAEIKPFDINEPEIPEPEPLNPVNKQETPNFNNNTQPQYQQYPQQPQYQQPYPQQPQYQQPYPQQPQYQQYPQQPQYQQPYPQQPQYQQYPQQPQYQQPYPQQPQYQQYPQQPQYQQPYPQQPQYQYAQPVMQPNAMMGAALNQMGVPPKAPKTKKKAPEFKSPVFDSAAAQSIEDALNQMGEGTEKKTEVEEVVPVFEEYVPSSKRATKVLVQDDEPEEENRVEENLSAAEIKEKKRLEKEAAKYEAKARKKLEKKGKL